MSLSLARRAALLGLIVIGLRVVTWHGYGNRDDFIPPTEIGVSLVPPITPPSLDVELEAQGFDLVNRESSRSPVRDGLDVVFSSSTADSIYRASDAADLKNTGMDNNNAELVGAQTMSSSARLATLVIRHDNVSEGSGITDGRERKRRRGAGRSKSIVDAPAMPIGVSSARSVDHRGQQIRMSSGGTCDDERREQDAVWASAREHLYVDYEVAVNQPSSSGEWRFHNCI